MNNNEQKQTDHAAVVWYQKKSKDVLSELHSSQDGLSSQEVEKRLNQYGKNKLPTKKSASISQVILRQLKSPLIYILVIAGIISFFIGEFSDALFIFVVVAINTLIGTIQEYKAEKSAEKLQEFIRAKVLVRRDGKEKEINADSVVPGDIVLLQSGKRVPADCRILQQQNLGTDESVLTGESTTVEKTAQIVEETDVGIGDQKNMAFAGTSIVSGRAEAVAVRTGMETQLGSISKAVTQTETEKLPLVRRMERFVTQLSIVILGAIVVLGVISLVRGTPIIEVFFMSVALAVSAIPEGLPVAMTVALAIGVNRMAKRRVIIRKLPAVEGLGSCTYIASDKTGTLTSNIQTAGKIALAHGQKFIPITVTGHGYSGQGELLHDEKPLDKDNTNLAQHLVTSGIIANEGTLVQQDGQWHHEGDPIDVALLALGYKAGFTPQQVKNELPDTAQIPYESQRKYAATFYREPDGTQKVAVKGALEKVLSFCKWVPENGDRHEIDTQKVKEMEINLAEQGFRVLAIASGKGAPDEKKLDQNQFDENIPELTLLGLVGFIDPLRPEVKNAIDECRSAGVRVGMITGDHPRTALAIARNLGIAENLDDLVTGTQLSDLKEKNVKEFNEKIRNASVFARINPLQKVAIVESLVNTGHFVAVTGDGVNDAPALRKANLGVAMGSGNDVAKDTGSVIITDDNFASIVSGIEEGRRAYQNLRKVIYLLIATGAAEVLLFTLAVILGIPIPLLAVQLLWLNLVTNGIQHIGLAFEKGEAGQMQRPPRNPEESVFNSLMIQEVIVTGATMALVTFGVWWWLIGNNTPLENARNLLLLLMVLFENFHVFNCRSERNSTFRIPLFNNVILIVGVLAAFSIHIISLYVPFLQNLLGTRPVSVTEFIVMFLLASTVLITGELYKLWRRKTH